MSAFKELLGPTLVQNAFARLKKWDVVKTEEVLAGKKVGLLFASSWYVEPDGLLLADFA